MERQAPWGVRIESNLLGFRAVATTFSFEFLFLVPFAGAFGFGILSWLYEDQWLPGQFKLSHSLFTIPFVVGMFAVGWQAAMRLFGRVVVESEGDDASVFEGIGPLGRTKRFRWSEVKQVGEGLLSDFASTRTKTSAIRVDFRDTKRSALKFGSMLSDKRLTFLVEEMQQRLGHK
ncbi:MAG: hypothetical protein ABI972_09505 [Acidobacteriota bacterium]